MQKRDQALREEIRKAVVGTFVLRSDSPVQLFSVVAQKKASEASRCLMRFQSPRTFRSFTMAASCSRVRPASCSTFLSFHRIAGI